ncbi:hypothetical protein [Streptomyces sp. H27-S2]|uniref:hypothetical protein n=1 Tax=Streptomyces antarcticus TaxID=2996458 RepID=UPI002271D7C5|nr:hypothetical protein [Streptomyces sp. H27-S2]MCY0954961.1 hypothetical protein [Streptomyces sp. H27-S2]
MALAHRVLTIRRDPHSGEVLARGGDPEAHSVLQRTRFIPVVRRHETYHRLPTGLDQDEEIRLATRAVAHLQAVGYDLDTDPVFATERREPHYLTLGDQVSHLATRIREAESTEEVADALTELTATHDGILPALAEILAATAEFLQDLGHPADPHTAVRLRHLADERLHVLVSDLRHVRNDLADRQAVHPHRSPCPQEVAGDEREKSASCPCPAPARIPTTPSAPAAAPPAPAGRRR